MEESIGVAASLPSRRELLAQVLGEQGWKAVPVGEGVPLPRCALAVIDLSDRDPAQARKAIEALSTSRPILAVGERRDLPALEAAVEAGASEFLIGTDRHELVARVRLLLGAGERLAAGRHRDSALVELAAAAGETLEPTAVIRAILGWLQRALPRTEAEVVITAPVAGGRIRRIQPGPGATLAFGHTELAERPELQRALAGEKLIHLCDDSDPDLEPTRVALRRDGFADLVAMRLHGGEPASALVVRSRDPIDLDELALIRAAGALASRALIHARSFDSLDRERERLERAYAARYHELLEANGRLRALSHQKDELLGICAHDLRLPLNAIRGHVRLLLEGSRGELPTTARESVESIRAQTARMAELLEDLLDLHALETGRLELKARPLDLSELTREVCDALRVTADERNVRIELRTPPAGPRLSGDDSKLREVVANLVGNAVKFSPPDETVEVAVEEMREGGGRLVVTDRGPGIPPEMLASLLAGTAPPGPAESRAGKGRGRGLGLAIAREITMLHGGKLAATSEVGRGSTFSVELPRQPAPAERPATTAAPVQRPAPAVPAAARVEPRVLVVEDDEDVRQLLVDLLEEDHEVLEASDGEEGVRRGREEAPDVILMDLFLPRLDGFAALEELKRDPRSAEIPVLFLTAERDESTRVRGLDLGAADFLVKPFSSVELKARIAKALRAARQQEQLRTIAQTDALTGLPNYRAFRTRLDEEVKRARRYHTSLAAVMVDLDNLKPINDTLGHAAGNRAIVSLAEAVTAQLRETDFAARYGGDEFVVLLPHTTAGEAKALAERLRRAIRRVEVDGTGLPLRASLGVAALAPGGGEASADALIRAADSALYRAKNTGRDRVCVAGEDERPQELGEGA